MIYGADLTLIKRFEYLEHISDAYIAAYGKSLEEAFENAALAMFELMIDTSAVEQKIIDTFNVIAHDKYELLYKWLETLLISFDINMKLYSKFNVKINEDVQDLILSATAKGEKYSSSRHQPKLEIKAITYHKMEIIAEPDLVIARYILDL